MVNMVDAETGETQLINTGSKSIRFEYEKHYHQQVDYFKDTDGEMTAISLKLIISNI